MHEKGARSLAARVRTACAHPLHSAHAPTSLSPQFVRKKAAAFVGAASRSGSSSAVEPAAKPTVASSKSALPPSPISSPENSPDQWDWRPARGAPLVEDSPRMPRLGLPRLERLVNYYSTLDQQALECHDAGSAPKDRDAKAAAPRADAKRPQAASPRQALNVLEASNANQARLVPGGTTPERGTPERERAAISVLTPKPTPKGAARPTPRRTPRATPKRTPRG